MALLPSYMNARPFICSQCLRTLRWERRHFVSAAVPDVFDVAVVGGGPAGLSLLTALRSSKATAHLRLALIESQDLKKTREWSTRTDQYSNRASSLTPASVQYLDRIGAWSYLDRTRIKPYQVMQVWDGLSSSGRISFDAPSQDSPIAYMTENQNLTRALTRRLDELPLISVFDKTSVADIQLGPPPDPSPTSVDLSLHPHVTLSSNATIATRLLVGADGINGPVRKFAGIPTRGWDYDRHGVVATVKYQAVQQDSDEATAYQRFLPTGPIALLPMPEDYATLVWTTTPERASHLKSLSPEDFVAMVNAAFRLSIVDINFMSTQPSGQVSELEWRSSVYPTTDMRQAGAIPRSVSFVQEGSIASFPLRLRQAASYTADRIALVGDAAHVIHPLAGQGLNMGLSDSQALAEVIENAIEHGADVGNELQCLSRYNSEAWMKNNRMLGVVDKLHWLYSAENILVVGARSLGLGAVDQMDGVKRWLMGQAGVP